jgi:mRNA interferase RelE/StbE
VAYKAGFSRIFLKKEERLPSDIKSRLVEVLREILVNPNVGVPLVGLLKGLWRVRIGKYRFLCEINEKEKMLVFHDVDLRKRVY